MNEGEPPRPRRRLFLSRVEAEQYATRFREAHVLVGDMKGNSINGFYYWVGAAQLYVINGPERAEEVLELARRGIVR